MAKTLTAASVPRIQLTPEDEFALRQLGAQLQREVVSAYEKFLFKDDKRVDDRRWKPAGRDGDLYAYAERKSAVKRDRIDAEAARHGFLNSSVHSKQAHQDEHPQAKLAADMRRRRVLVTGTQAGLLDDVMYGFAFQDTKSFNSFWASQNAIMQENAVLAKMEGPSFADPYRFEGVVWVLRSFILPASVLNKRDMLTYVDLHLSKLSNGERIGVYSTHSIQHRDLVEMRELDTIRATLSMIRVFRQIDDNRVEIYTTQLLDVKGSAPEALNIIESVNFLLPTTRQAISEAFRKKLRWLMSGRDRTRHGSAMSDTIEPLSSGSNDQCEICSRTIGRMFSSPGTSCHLCYKRVCSRCNVAQDGLDPVQTSNWRWSTAKTTDFCIQCILHAKSLQTLPLAQDGLIDVAHDTGRSGSKASGSHSVSSSSSSGSSGVEARKRTLTMLLPDGECPKDS